MNPIKTFTVTVMCPITARPETMHIQYVYRTDFSRFYFPCAGCDNCHGSDRCDRCCAALTLMFHKGYEHTPGEAITPDFELLQ